jgi:hypothetical protein
MELFAGYARIPPRFLFHRLTGTPTILMLFARRMSLSFIFSGRLFTLSNAKG